VRHHQLLSTYGKASKAPALLHHARSAFFADELRPLARSLLVFSPRRHFFFFGGCVRAQKNFSARARVMLANRGIDV
jgi:hypothetical protein